MPRSVRFPALASAFLCLASLALSACGSGGSHLPTASAGSGLAGSAPASSTPGSSAPGSSAPGSSAPVGSTPRSSAPGSSARAGSTPASSTPGSSASAGFVGYDWLVVAIAHDGATTSIPPQLNVNIRFLRSGRFGANDSVNSYSGTFTTMRGGFATSALAGTLVGYAGHDPAVLVSQSVMIAFGNGGAAAARVTGDRLVVTVGSFTLTCQRHGPAGNNL